MSYFHAVVGSEVFTGDGVVVLLSDGSHNGESGGKENCIDCVGCNECVILHQ